MTLPSTLIERKNMAEKWIAAHPWTLVYVAVIVSISLILQVSWR